MKAGWKSAELASVSVVFTDGNWIETKDQSSEGIRLVQTGNVGKGVFKDRREKARWIDEETFARLNCFEVLPGDCLISRLPDPVGRACLIPETGDKMITAVDCTVVRSDEAKIDQGYLVYYMQSREYLRDVDGFCSGTTRRRISRKNLGKVIIPLPPLEEQQRIVVVLDEAFEGLARARAHAEANLQNARELFPQLRNGLLESGDGWRTATLSELLERITYGFTNPMPNADEGPYKVTAKNVLGGAIDYDGARRTTPEAFRDLLTDKSRPKIGDVLLTKDGTLGRTAVVDRDGICVNQSVAVLTPTEEIIPEYLSEMLSCARHQKAMIANAGGTTIKHLYITRVPKIVVEFPGLQQQREILNELTKLRSHCEDVENNAKDKIADLDDLRQSLLQKAFAGELT